MISIVHQVKSRFRTVYRLSYTHSLTFCSASVNSVDLPLTLKVKSILNSDDDIIGRTVRVKGWVKSIRDQKNVVFAEISDGSSLRGIQAVSTESVPDCFNLMKSFTTGISVDVCGRVIKSLGKNQLYEVSVESLEKLGNCPPESYPLAKKRHTLEYLRTIAHLRTRSNTIGAMSRLKSTLTLATHSFFQQQKGFTHVQTPIITTSDCEGAGSMFRVTTLPLHDMHRIKTVKVNTAGPTSVEEFKNDSSASESATAAALPSSVKADLVPKSADFRKDFFGKAAYLTVSGQLSAEACASGLGDVYTFGPTFRAEASETSRHLAEFHMIEPELSFCDMDAAMDNAEEFVRYVTQFAMEHNAEDMSFFQEMYARNNKLIKSTAAFEEPQNVLRSRIDGILYKPFARITYKNAVKLLAEEIAKNPSKWKYPDMTFGVDLQTEHERWLAEVKFGTCVFVHNYPRSIKPFYMRDDEGCTESTVSSFDLLVPGIGELIGGSQREERIEVLLDKMIEFDMLPASFTIDDIGDRQSDYWWYLELRKFGTVPHAGYGLGFERLVCYLSGIENIRDAMLFPRFSKHADF